MDKQDAVSKLSEIGKAWDKGRQRVVRFEHDFLNPIISHDQFLRKPHNEQRRLWLKAWDILERELKDEEDDVILDMHACIVTNRYGVRVLLDHGRVMDVFKPDVIITLIDNVYDCWWRTEFRARNFELIGRPTLEQLLTARRTELIVGDQLAFSLEPHVKHYALAMAHSVDTLARLAYLDAFVVYLCFPISAPRRMLPDTTGVQAINNFLAQAFARQTRSERRTPVFICPLTIDELPLRAAYLRLRRQYFLEHHSEQAPEDKNVPPNSTPAIDAEMSSEAGDMEQEFLDKEELDFDVSAKWHLQDLWNPIGNGSPSKEQRISFPAAQLDAASGMIDTDVAWRDYRLIDQSDAVIVFNPSFDGKKVARSVSSEIRSASHSGKPVVVFQDRTIDPQGLLQEMFRPGTMAADEVAEGLMYRDALEEAFETIEIIGKRRGKL